MRRVLRSLSSKARPSPSANEAVYKLELSLLPRDWTMTEAKAYFSEYEFSRLFILPQPKNFKRFPFTRALVYFSDKHQAEQALQKVKRNEPVRKRNPQSKNLVCRLWSPGNVPAVQTIVVSNVNISHTKGDDVRRFFSKFGNVEKVEPGIWGSRIVYFVTFDDLETSSKVFLHKWPLVLNKSHVVVRPFFSEKDPAEQLKEVKPLVKKESPFRISTKEESEEVDEEPMNMGQMTEFLNENNIDEEYPRRKSST